jgi:hypothetical protein
MVMTIAHLATRNIRSYALKIRLICPIFVCWIQVYYGKYFMKNLNIPAIFKSDADEIIRSREDAIRIHGTNIRAAGNEIEICIREYFKRMLPPKYYITQGHLIDRSSNVSSQLDFIISDNSSLPSLMTTKDGTEYIPIDSTYVVGEIKSTFYKTEKSIEKFSSVIKNITKDLVHEEIPNTVFDGIKNDSLMQDMILGSNNRILNRIFFFMLFTNSGNFKFEDIVQFYSSHDKKYLPNMVVFLDKGIILRASIIDEAFGVNKYPEDAHPEENWYFVPFPGIEEDKGSLEGNHLAFLYYSLLTHLTNSHLEPPSLSGYLSRVMIGRKSLIKKVDENKS